MTLVEFLLARIAEDEEAAICPDPAFSNPIWEEGPTIEWTDDGLMTYPHRVVAECDAKRRIVDDLQLAEIAESRPAKDYEAAAPYVTNSLRRVAMHLAVVCADHPDWREEWRI